MAAQHAFTRSDIQRLRRAHRQQMPHHLREAHEVRDHFCRMILKDRMLGFTFYFAREALMVALERRRDQMIIAPSASAAQVYRDIAVRFIRETLGVKVFGQNLELKIDGHVRPVSIFYAGAQSRLAERDGVDRYYEEFLWWPKFTPPAPGERTTYFSSPTPQAHPGYAFWKGKDLDLSWENLRYGFYNQAGVWRQVIAFEDAREQGFDLLDPARIEFWIDRRDQSANRVAESFPRRNMESPA